jgi:hypothetical protein
MPADPNSPTVVFLRALHNLQPTEAQLAALDPAWAELVRAAVGATPVNRRAAVVLIKAGRHDPDQLLAVLRGQTAAENRPWPDPTPFGTAHLPTFPDRALPPWLGNYVRAESRATQTPVDLAAMLALAVLSSALAGPIVLNPWGDWIEPLNLFTLVVLPPGHRKSAIFNAVTAPLHQFEAEAARSAAPLIALASRRQHAAEQALLRAQDAAALCPVDDPRRPQLLAEVDRRLEALAAAEAPVAPRLIADDCSPERLAMLLAEHGGRLAILSPEGGIFDLIAGRYSSTGAPNLDHVLKGHAGDPIVVDRVGRPGEIVLRPALTIGLAVQPEVLRSLLARPGFHGRGLLARVLYAVPIAALGRRGVDLEGVDHTIRADYHHHVRALLALTHPDHPSHEHPDPERDAGRQHLTSSQAERACFLPLSSRAERACPPFLSSRPERACERSRGISRSAAAQHEAPPGPSRRDSNPGTPLGTTGTPVPRYPVALPHRPAPITHHPAHVLPFDPFAADRLREFAEAVEPRLAPPRPDGPGGDLDPIVDWASKLVGATARIAGLLHLASLPQLDELDPAFTPGLPLSIAMGRGAGGRGDTGAMGIEGPHGRAAPRVPCWDEEVGLPAVESAILIAEYLIEHAKAAYAAMGLDPTVANVPALLAWVRRTGRASFTRRDARRSLLPRLRSDADLDDALDQLEQHGYVRLATPPSSPRGGRPSPTYHVHPSLVRR